MKAQPEHVAPTLSTTARALRFVGVWLSLTGYVSALAFVPTVEHRLQAPGLGAYAQFGIVVDVCGDTAVVGCPGFVVNNAWVGAALVFVLRDNQWIHQATFIPDGAPADTDFGCAVAISQNTIVVGAVRDNGFGPFSGTAYVFTRFEATWYFEAELTPADPQAYLQFGDPVAIDGERIAIGAIADSETAAASGAVYLFQRDSTTWSQEAKLKPNVPVAGALFGFSLSLRGEQLAVGAPFHTHSSLSSAGAAYLFQPLEGAWVQIAQFTAADATASSLLGWSVAVAPNLLLAGAPLAREGTITPGAAYLFQSTESGWAQSDKLMDASGASGAWFGFSIALRENLVAVGASKDSAFGASAGAICLYSPQAGLWQQTHKFSTSSPAAGSQLGFNLAYDGNHLIAGAPFQAEPLTPLIGAAFVFSPSVTAPPNEPPLADASATPSTALATNGSDAELLLDGSRSSDPEGDPLAFRWLEADTLIAETQTTVVRLAVGSHTLLLEVSDGINVSTDTVQITILTPVQTLDDIIDQLQIANLPPGQSQTLERLLTNARRALERNRIDQSLRHLQTALDYLRIQAGRRLDPLTAQSLETALRQFTDALQAS